MHSFAWWPTVIVLAVATFTDLRNRRIPNWLVVPFLVAGIGFRLAPGLAWTRVQLCWPGTRAPALRNSVLDGRHGGRGRKAGRSDRGLDWPESVVHCIDCDRHGGGLMVLGWALFGGFLKDLFKGAGDHMKRKMPYAPAIAIGTLVSFFAR
jgi:prepilin peptidase CpaA